MTAIDSSGPSWSGLLPVLKAGRRPRHLLRNTARVLLSKYYLRNCSHVGSLPRVWGRPRIVNHGALIIGDRLMAVSRVVPIELAVSRGARLEIGNRAYINYGTTIAAYKSISIGDRVLLGVYTIITDNDQHRLEPDRRNELPESEPVVIEEDVWIGDRVTILKGVRIGAGVVIGAGSVVTRDIPPWTMAAGNPARVIRDIARNVEVKLAQESAS